jgi:hypothetical protein
MATFKYLSEGIDSFTVKLVLYINLRVKIIVIARIKPLDGVNVVVAIIILIFASFVQSWLCNVNIAPGVFFRGAPVVIESSWAIANI